MKTFEVQIPEGHEIDKENSTFEKIVFKKLEKRLPLSTNEIPDRPYYINGNGDVCKNHQLSFVKPGIHNLSTQEKAEAFLALMQLVELRDAWNEGWKPNWEDLTTKYAIEVIRRNPQKSSYSSLSCPLAFKSIELRDKFLEEFKDLIETAKELL